MSFLSGLWDGITWIPRQVGSVVTKTVGSVLGWGSNQIGNVLQGIGVQSISTPIGGFSLTGQPSAQAPTFQQTPPYTVVPSGGIDWGKILLFGGIGLGILVIIIVVVPLLVKSK